MKRVLLLMLAPIASIGILAGTAAADTGGVSIETGNSYDAFVPNPVGPGDTTNITVTTFQNGAVGSDATVTFTGLPADLSFQSNGDPSAVCGQAGTTVTCTYTDYGHTAKSDSYTFSVNGVFPTTKGECKDGGWMNFTPLFNNQGDCVSYVASGGKNPPTGETFNIGIEVVVAGVGTANETVPLTIS